MERAHGQNHPPPANFFFCQWKFHLLSLATLQLSKTSQTASRCKQNKEKNKQKETNRGLEELITRSTSKNTRYETMVTITETDALSTPAILLDDGPDDVSQVIVHPLVLLHVLDHHSRRAEVSGRVIGTLLGRRDGKKVRYDYFQRLTWKRTAVTRCDEMRYSVNYGHHHVICLNNVVNDTKNADIFINLIFPKFLPPYFPFFYSIRRPPVSCFASSLQTRK